MLWLNNHAASLAVIEGIEIILSAKESATMCLGGPQGKGHEKFIKLRSCTNISLAPPWFDTIMPTTPQRDFKNLWWKKALDKDLKLYDCPEDQPWIWSPKLNHQFHRQTVCAIQNRLDCLCAQMLRGRMLPCSWLRLEPFDDPLGTYPLDEVCWSSMWDYV